MRLAAITTRDDRDPERIVFSATGPADGLRSAVATLLETGRRVDLLTTCVTEDGPAYEAIAREFGVALLAPLTWQEVVAEKRRCALVVSNRLHGLILGSLADALLLPIGARKKSEAFARDAGMPVTFNTLATVDAAGIDSCLSHRSEALAAMRAYRDRPTPPLTF